MLEILLALLSVILAIISVFLIKKLADAYTKIDELESRLKGEQIKKGLLAEQLLPFAKQFPFKPENFRFLGSPIDGIAFEENCIYFCEFKLKNARLSEREKHIKELVKNRKVAWLEFSAES